MRYWALGLIVVITGAANAEDKAAEVVKKGIEAHGGTDALNKYLGARYSIKGEVDVQGTDTEFTGNFSVMSPDKAHMTLSLEFMGVKIGIESVMNGEKSKQKIKVNGEDQAGREEPKEELQMAIASRQAQMLTPLLDAKKFTIKSSDDEDVNGKRMSVVAATPKTIDREMKLYFDKDSGLLVKVAHKGLGPDNGGSRADVYKETFLSDFKKFNGIQVATKMVLNHDNKKFMTATLSDYESLEKIDDSEFKLGD
ncbi:MAG TPA: hypothetical protein VHR66_20595 [Gemmataceae bacterium]|nr:hypothetical protein [Gemmataceae bacterium]